jgi:hypothetical protein
MPPRSPINFLVRYPLTVKGAASHGTNSCAKRGEIGICARTLYALTGVAGKKSPTLLGLKFSDGAWNDEVERK